MILLPLAVKAVCNKTKIFSGYMLATHFVYYCYILYLLELYLNLLRIPSLKCMI